MSRRRAERCVDAATGHERHDDLVAYPHWYLKRWHFLPEGYLSDRSATWYDALVRRVYYVGLQAAVLGAVADALAACPPIRLLEVGCASGRALRSLGAAFPGARFTGLDLSPFLLERASHVTAPLGGQAQLVHGNGEHLPFEAGSFDAVYAGHVIGHLPAQSAEAVLTEIQRALEPGGQVVLLDHTWHPSNTGALAPVSQRWLAGGLLRLTVLRSRPVAGDRPKRVASVAGEAR